MNTWVESIQTHFESKIKKDELILKVCPFCGNSNWNIEINLKKELYHCWVCNQRGTLKNFLYLTNIQGDTGWKLSKYMSEGESSEKANILEATILEKLLWDSEYMKYESQLFSSKGLSEKDIHRYNLRYSVSGKYKGYMIIPLYEGERLCYLVYRTPTVKGRYYNIEVDKEFLLPYYLGDIEKYTLFLCEGAFDAISVNKLGYSSGVLLGNSLNITQITKIKSFGFEKVVICLDGDLSKKALSLLKISCQYIPSSIVLFDRDNEPNDLYVKNKTKLDSMLQDSLSNEITFSEKVKVLL